VVLRGQPIVLIALALAALVASFVRPALNGHLLPVALAILLFQGSNHLEFSPRGAIVRVAMFIAVGLLAAVRPYAVELGLLLAVGIGSIYFGRVPGDGGTARMANETVPKS
jgi:hypothetical protein